MKSEEVKTIYGKVKYAIKSNMMAFTIRQLKVSGVLSFKSGDCYMILKVSGQKDMLPLYMNINNTKDLDEMSDYTCLQVLEVLKDLLPCSFTK